MIKYDKLIIKKMLSPKPLQSGDKVAFVAPATRVRREEVQRAIQIFETWGLQVVLGKNTFEQYYQFAGSDVQRAEDFQEMLDDPEVSAIICARGGYGTLRIIDKLDFTKFLENPKWVVGFSDVTVLHNHLNELGVETIHGSMPLLMPRQTKSSIVSLKNALFNQKLRIEALPHTFNRMGTAKGEVIGGNLSLFSTTLGTKSEIDTTDKILFIEDVDEYIYHIDRLIIHLKRAGKLKNLSGLIIGQFTDIKDDKENPFGRNIYETIQELTAEYNYPIFYNFPAGHHKKNMALIFGRRARLDVNENNASLHFKLINEA
jgi:muramoyltetrapeptide carboxypeptidase